MPYSHTTQYIPPELDRRRKITDQQRIEIKQMYASGKYSTRELARLFGVSRKLIQLYKSDEKLAHHKELYAARRIDGRYYNKDTWAATMRNHRAYKQSLKLKGNLVDEK